MFELEFTCLKQGSNLLNNTGYRRPQVHAKESVDANFLIGEKGSLAAMHTRLELCKLPVQGQTNLRSWVDSLVKQTGFGSLDELIPLLDLPSNNCLVFELQDESEAFPTDVHEMIRTAVILSKCTASSYDPKSPMIFTEKRLNRKVQLITINLDAYYGME